MTSGNVVSLSNDVQMNVHLKNLILNLGFLVGTNLNGVIAVVGSTGCDRKLVYVSSEQPTWRLETSASITASVGSTL